MRGYNDKSCNAFEKPFYRPIEAAIRWCGLLEHETQILAQLGENGIPKTGQFPRWPCLQVNTEKIHDAILHGDIPHGRDGKTLIAGDHVAPGRRTVRHNDLRDWMAHFYPDQKPHFLFGEIERERDATFNADSLVALQADLDAARKDLENKEAWATKIAAERDALLLEREPPAINDKPTTTNERNTLLIIIAALCHNSGIKHQERGAASQIAKLTEETGAPVSDDTVRRVLSKIPDAQDSRMK